MESFRFLVAGRVQGVFYRKFIARRLREIGVQGYIRNLSDGRVEVVVRATDEELDPIEKILEEGSPLSEVERIEMETLEGDDLIYEGFEIRY